MEEEAQKEIPEKTYWHTTFEETIPGEELQTWLKANPENYTRIQYLGDFTPGSWKKFIQAIPKDNEDRPLLSGKPIDSKGNVIEPPVEKP